MLSLDEKGMSLYSISFWTEQEAPDTESFAMDCLYFPNDRALPLWLFVLQAQLVSVARVLRATAFPWCAWPPPPFGELLARFHPSFSPILPLPFWPPVLPLFVLFLPRWVFLLFPAAEFSAAARTLPSSPPPLASASRPGCCACSPCARRCRCGRAGTRRAPGPARAGTRPCWWSASGTATPAAGSVYFPGT